MSRWFRHYAGMMADPKFGAIARRSKASRAEVLFVWGCILEDAAENGEARYTWDADLCADLLACDTDHAQRIHDELERSELVRNGVVSAWDRRQFVSDNSTERSRTHRQRKRDGDATLHPVAASPPETETEPEPEIDTAVAIAPAVARAVALPKPTKARSSRRCPAVWMPSPQDLAVVEALGFSPGQIERELATLRDHEFRDAKTDWSATFRNWFRRKDPPREQRSYSSPPPNGRAEKRSVWTEIAAAGDPARAGGPP